MNKLGEELVLGPNQVGIPYTERSYYHVSLLALEPLDRIDRTPNQTGIVI